MRRKRPGKRGANRGGVKGGKLSLFLSSELKHDKVLVKQKRTQAKPRGWGPEMGQDHQRRDTQVLWTYYPSIGSVCARRNERNTGPFKGKTTQVGSTTSVHRSTHDDNQSIGKQQVQNLSRGGKGEEKRFKPVTSFRNTESGLDGKRGKKRETPPKKGGEQEGGKKRP